jgi:hypothetical protein
VLAAFAWQGSARRAREFDAACTGFSGGPADKTLIEEMFPSPSATTDALIALSGASAAAGYHHDRGYGLDFVRPQR